MAKRRGLPSTDFETDYLKTQQLRGKVGLEEARELPFKTFGRPGASTNDLLIGRNAQSDTGFSRSSPRLARLIDATPKSREREKEQ